MTVLGQSTSMKRTLSSVLNLVDVCLIFGLIVLLFTWTPFPITIIRTIEILVAIYYTFRVVKRDESFRSKTPTDSRVDSPFNEQDESGQLPQPAYFEKSSFGLGEPLDTIGCVVGWREEDQLFRECLHSLKAATCLSTLVVGVDGDSDEDKPMLEIFREVFPNAPQAVHFDVPVGECFELRDGLLGTQAEQDLDVILDRVEATMVEQIGMAALMGASAIQVYQPHQCKKSILFTAFLVSLVLSRLGRGEYTWSSDSDSVVRAGVVEMTIAHMREHPEAGGAAGRLRNRPAPGMISKVIGSKYWFDQDVTRAQTAISGDAECQPGPCTVTRVTALREVVVEWYNQRFLGRRCLTNEDRHLTTRFLRRGWKVYYVPQAVVETDSPITLFAWIRQQNRWSRGTHIERFSQPLTYVLKSPWFTVHVWKEQIIPIIAMACICEYVLTGHFTLRVSSYDYIISLIIELVYVLLTCGDRPTRDDLVWLVPAQLFYNTVKPAIHLWGVVTLFENSWKSNFKANSLSRRLWEVGPCMMWMNVVMALQGRLTADAINYFHHDFVSAKLMTIGVPVLFLPVWIYMFCGDHWSRR